jgi:hypothetical protein
LGSWGKEWRPRGCRVEEGEEEEESIGVDDDDDGGTSCLSPSWPWPWLVVAVPSPRGMVCAAYRSIERVKEREKKRERKREWIEQREKSDDAFALSIDREKKWRRPPTNLGGDEDLLRKRKKPSLPLFFRSFFLSSSPKWICSPAAKAGCSRRLLYPAVQGAWSSQRQLHVLLLEKTSRRTTTTRVSFFSGMQSKKESVSLVLL